MIVDLDVVDIYTAWKTKTPWKMQKNNNLLKTKRILNIKMWTKGDPVSAFRLPGGAARSSAPPPMSYVTASVCPLIQSLSIRKQVLILRNYNKLHKLQHFENEW